MFRTIVYLNTYVQGILVEQTNGLATVDVYGKCYTGVLVPKYRKE